MSETTIKTLCPDCNEKVAIEAGDVIELVRGNAEAPGFYAFTCPICSHVKKKEITNPEVFNVLVLAGVSETELPPITEDEIEEFVQELGYESYLAQIVELEK